MIHTLANGTRICTVDVPVNDIEDFEIIRDQDNYDQKQFKYPTDKYQGLQNYGWVNIPEGNWQILGRFSEITEETWKGIVDEPLAECEDCEPLYLAYWYSQNQWPYIFETATESARSLIPGNPVVLIEKK